MESNVNTPRMKRHKALKNLVLCGLFAAVTAILTLITIPLPSGVPITLQTFAIALSAYTLGAKYGTVSTGVYIALGAVGLPVYSGAKGGFAVLSGATGGYIFGFLPFAALCGLGLYLGLKQASGKKKAVLSLAFGLVGLLLCHLFGTLQFAVLTHRGLLEAAALASVPYLAKDILSVVFAYLLAVKLRFALRMISH